MIWLMVMYGKASNKRNQKQTSPQIRRGHGCYILFVIISFYLSNTMYFISCDSRIRFPSLQSLSW